MPSRSKTRRQTQQTASRPVQTHMTPVWAWMALGIILLANAAIRIRLMNCPLERDEGEFAYMGQLMLQGIPPYKLAYNMKFPGIYAAYALMMAIFGQTIAGVHLGLMLVNLISVTLIFFLAKRLFDPLAGVVAALILAVTTITPDVLGTSGHATQYVLPFVIGGCLVLLRGIESGRTSLLVTSGLLFGTAVLMKQHAALFIPFALLYYVWTQISARQIGARRIAANSVLMAIGAVAPFAVTCIILKAVGVFDKFWFWTFTYAHQYVTQYAPAKAVTQFKGAIPKVIDDCKLIWVLAGIGLSAIAWNRKVRKHGIFLAGILIFGFLSVCPGFHFRNHYFITLLPAIALLASACVAAFRDLMESTPRAVRAIPVILVIVAAVIPMSAERQILFQATPNEVSKMMYSINPFTESVEIGEYIRKHSTKDDTVAVIGSEPQIYFYSQRHSATGFIYVYGLMEAQAYASQMQRDMIREIETARPKYVVFVKNPLSWLPNPESDKGIFDWADSWVMPRYTLVGVSEIIDPGYDDALYSNTYWGEDAIDHMGTSPFCVYVLERKPDE